MDDARRTASLARQNLLPQLDLNLGVSQLGLGPSFGDGLAHRRPARQRLPVQRPTRSSARAASANRAVAELDLVGARSAPCSQRELEVEAEVRAAVRELEQIRKSVELQQKAVEVAEQQRRLATLRYQRGPGLQLRRGGRRGQPGRWRAARSSACSTSYQVARVELLRVTGSLDVDAEFLP